MSVAGCAIAGDATLKGFPASALNHGVTSTDKVAKELGGSWLTGQSTQSVSTAIQSLGDGATGVIFGSRGNRKGWTLF